MNQYEFVVVFSETTTPEQIDAFTAQVTAAVTGEGSAVEVVPWGRRELSYVIKKCHSGLYVQYNLTCAVEVPPALEAKARIHDNVIRYLTVSRVAPTMVKNRPSRDSDEVEELYLDYKRPDQLFRFISERGKILPRRVSRIGATEQRDLARAVKRARLLAMLPFSTLGQ